jgi:uncharacterized protein YllA (UPF0747 family)
MTFLVNIEYQNFTRIHIEKIILQMLPLFKESKKQIVHGTEGQREKWLCENTVISILDYVEYFRHKFTRACEIEHDNLKQSQVKMKQWYDKDIMIR